MIALIVIGTVGVVAVIAVALLIYATVKATSRDT